MHAKQTRNWVTDLIGLGILFFGFYRLWLGSYPLFSPDEARYSEVAREMIASGDWITPKVNGIPFLDKPVLYYWLQACAIYLFGIKEWAIRLSPMLSGVLGCLMTYVCGRQLFDRKTGVISALILATTPLYFGAAHYANLDLEVATWISCSLFCIITSFSTKGNTQRNFMVGAYFFAALGLLTKGLIGVVFPLMITGIWMLIAWRWDIFKKLYLKCGLVILALLTIPWYVAVQRANPDFFHYFFYTQQFSRFVSHGEFNNKNAFWFYLPVVLAGFFPWTLFLPVAIGRSLKAIWHSTRTHAKELFLIIWALAVFIFFSIPQSKLIGYILPVFPALALLTGYYLAQIWDSAEARWHNGMTLVIFCIIAGIGFATLPQHQDGALIQSARPILLALANIVTASGLLLLICLQSANLRRLFFFCTTLTSVLLLVIVANAHMINNDSTRHLVTILQKKSKPQDIIVDYYKFHQDVPLYLKKKIQLVADWDAPDIDKRDNWVRELWLGKSTPGANDTLISEQRFWQSWKHGQRVFVFVGDNYFEQFKMRAPHYHIIAKDNDVYLLSNRVI